MQFVLVKAMLGEIRKGGIAYFKNYIAAFIPLFIAARECANRFFESLSSKLHVQCTLYSVQAAPHPRTIHEFTFDFYQQNFIENQFSLISSIVRLMVPKPARTTAHQQPSSN